MQDRPGHDAGVPSAHPSQSPSRSGGEFIDGAKRDRLAVAASRRLAAMAASSAGEFFAYGASLESHRLTRRQDRAFNKIASIYRYEFGQDPEEEDVLDTYRTLWDRLAIEKGYRLDQIGTGDDGLRTIFFTVRSPQDLSILGPQQLGEDVTYWLGLPLTFSATFFHQPIQSLEELLESTSPARIAVVHAIGRYANGNPIGLILLWYLDPEFGDWVCFKAYGNAARGAKVMM